MAYADMQDYLAKLEARAKHDLHTLLTNNLLRPIVLFAGVGLGIGCGLGTGRDPALSTLVLLLCAVGGGVAGWLLGRVASGHTVEYLARLRKEVRQDLDESGLLALIMEPEPFERLPSLRPKLVELPVRPPRSTDGGSFTARLERLVENYRAVSKDYGLEGHIGIESPSLLSIAVRIELSGLLGGWREGASAEAGQEIQT